MLFKVFDSGIDCMVFVPSSDEVWAASGAAINRLSTRVSHSLATSQPDTSFQTKGSLLRPIIEGSEVRDMETVYRDIWVACQSGRITVYRDDGTFLRTFWAHESPILKMVPLGDYVWSISTADCKVWKLQTAGFERYMVSCSHIFSSQEVNLPLIASTESFFTISQQNTPLKESFITVNEWTPSGMLKSRLASN